MKLAAPELVAAGGAASVLVLDKVSIAWFGVPIAAWAAAFFGALFGMLYMPSVIHDSRPWKQIVAVPACTGVGVILAALFAQLFDWEKPAIISGLALVIAATPVFFVKLLQSIMRRKAGVDDV